MAVNNLNYLGQSIYELIDISKRLQTKHITLVSIDEKIDTTTPAGDVFFAIIAAMSKIEKLNRSQKIKSGLDKARKKGRKAGRPCISKEQFETAKQLLKDGQTTIEQAAAALNMGKSTLYKHLKETGEPAANKRKLGRPSFGEDKIEEAKKMLANGSNYAQVSAALNVTKATLYKHIPLKKNKENPVSC